MSRISSTDGEGACEDPLDVGMVSNLRELIQKVVTDQDTSNNTLRKTLDAVCTQQEAHTNLIVAVPCLSGRVGSSQGDFEWVAVKIQHGGSDIEVNS